MKDFAGKVALITGAGSGFGREFARIGAGLGMKLVLGDVQRDALDSVVAELRTAGADVEGLAGDVTRAAGVQALADTAVRRFGGIHLAFETPASPCCVRPSCRPASSIRTATVRPSSPSRASRRRRSRQRSVPAKAQ